MSEQLLKATHSGDLKIAGIVIPCAVLNNGQRVLTQRGFSVAIGRYKNPRKTTIVDLPVFLQAQNLRPFITEDLARSSIPIRFRSMKSGGVGGNLAFGYPAELLPQVCQVYIDAEEAEATTPSQKRTVEQCKLLYRGFATVGIIALIDEATGYQEIRDRIALQEILDRYLTDEWAKWTKTFPDEFYKELFRLKGLSYPVLKRPGYVGHWTNNIVYSRLAPMVLSTLRELNPKLPSGHRARMHHQHMTREYGHPKLTEHLSNVIFMMKSCTSWDDFIRRLNRAAPRYGATIEFDLVDDSGHEIE